MKKQNEKLAKCFLITPIGSSDSVDRSRLNQWCELIYEPAVKDKYKLIRADKISTPGRITKQIIDNIIDAELAIIDFTPNYKSITPNPNVMYEAAIRHITKKATIQIAPVNVEIPFDIKDFRCIPYSPNDLTYPLTLKKEVMKAIKAMDDPDYKPIEIIGKSFDLKRIVSDPEEFIKILKEQLLSNYPKGVKFEDAINYGGTSVPSYGSYWGATGPSGPVGGGGGGSAGFSDYSVGSGPRCPNCGSIVTRLSSLADLYNAAGQPERYRCTNCGFTFFSKF